MPKVEASGNRQWAAGLYQVAV